MSNLYKKYLKSFDIIINSEKIDSNNSKTNLSLFVHKINANDFDYEIFENAMYDLLPEFALSSQTRENYASSPMRISREARQKFKDGLNTGELGEFVLDCFLKSHLEAKKVLSKLELKTSNKHYVHGSDGIHLKKIGENRYHLIFGESKTIISLKTAIREAIQSIYEFKNELNNKGEVKSGIRFEHGLISQNLDRENFEDEEYAILKSLTYPTEEEESMISGIDIDDAFSIFIGYEVEVSAAERNLSPDDFKSQLHSKIEEEVRSSFLTISQKIQEKSLNGHSFYIYILPFTNLESSRKSITNKLVS